MATTGEDAQRFLDDQVEVMTRAMSGSMDRDDEVYDIFLDHNRPQAVETVTRLLDAGYHVARTTDVTFSLTVADTLAMLKGTTPGLWRVQGRHDRLVDEHVATVHPEGRRRSITSTLNGAPAMSVPDAELIVTLHNALTNAAAAALASVPTDPAPEE
jgi:hypothetical protein